MANLNSIVSIINESLKKNSFNDKRFQKVAAFGISKSLPYGTPGKYELIPTELDNNGEGKKLSPDDKNPIQIYHKVNSVAYSNARVQFGNGNNSVVRTAAMSMIVFAQRKKIKLNEDMLDLYIQAGLPSKISAANLSLLQLNDCTIKSSGTDFNSTAIWSREYNLEKYYLKPEHLFFEVKYSIECIFKKSCIKTSTDC